LFHCSFDDDIYHLSDSSPATNTTAELLLAAMATIGKQYVTQTPRAQLCSAPPPIAPRPRAIERTARSNATSISINVQSMMWLHFE